LRVWGGEEAVADLVRVRRAFRPGVVVTRFAPQPGATPTHGHHTASSVLAVEAFKLAGDARAFPDQLGALSPWQPKRIVQNLGTFGGAAVPASDTGGVVKMEIGGTDPVLGESFAAIAARRRAMHKTQGFAQPGRAPPGGTTESFVLLAGEPASGDLFDGVDTTWNRVPGGAEIGRLAAATVDQFKPADPAASLAALL